MTPSSVVVKVVPGSSPALGQFFLLLHETKIFWVRIKGLGNQDILLGKKLKIRLL